MLKIEFNYKFNNINKKYNKIFKILIVLFQFKK